MECCPVCQQGRLRIIAAITEVGVIKKILRYLKLAVDPPPIAPAQQAAFAWAKYLTIYSGTFWLLISLGISWHIPGKMVQNFRPGT